MLEEFIIQGKTKLKGRIRINGAKNSVLKLLTACLLTDQPMTLLNVPHVSDVFSMLQLLEVLGSNAHFANDQINIVTPQIISETAPYEFVRKMRASIGVLGPLLARHKKAIVSLPGGCSLGARAVDIHLNSLTAMGADIHLENGYIHAKGDLKGATLNFHFPSMGATENVMMAATLAKGTTIIHNAAREPEIVDLANMLCQMGAQIQGQGTSTIEIQGVDQLKGTKYTTLSDRLETSTYAMAALITEGEIDLYNTKEEFLSDIKTYIKGAVIQNYGDYIKVSGKIEDVANITTAPFPGFPTDLQAPTMTLLTQAPGMSTIHEALFENRFTHVPELIRMGAKIEIKDRTAYIYGKTPLYGAPVMATDLRAGIALVLAGLVAQGETRIKRIYHIDRGYAHLVENLTACGADIKRAPQEADQIHAQG